MNQLLVPKNQSGIHLKTFLMQWGLSASYWKALKKARALFVNGLVTVWDIPLSANDRVSFPFLPEETDLVPEEGPLTILYEDEVLLAVHKEQGLLVHNSGLTQESSLSRRVLFYYREHGIKAALHPVSRLDRETSGIVLFAKNAALHHMLTKAPMKKLYLALSHGPWEKFSGVIAQPIARKDGSLIERCVAPQGQAGSYTLPRAVAGCSEKRGCLPSLYRTHPSDSRTCGIHGASSPGRYSLWRKGVPKSPCPARDAAPVPPSLIRKGREDYGPVPSFFLTCQ